MAATLDIPMVLFGSGVLQAMAVAAPRASALAAAAPARRRTTPAAAEQTWVVFAAAAITLPCALWQAAGGATLYGLAPGRAETVGGDSGVMLRLPLVNLDACGMGCSLGLAVAATVVTVGLVAAPGVLSPQWLTSPGASPGLLMLSAVVLCAVEPMLGGEMTLGAPAVAVCCVLLAAAAALLTSWSKPPIDPKAAAKRRAAIAAPPPPWAVPILMMQVRSSPLLFVFPPSTEGAQLSAYESWVH